MPIKVTKSDDEGDHVKRRGLRELVKNLVLYGQFSMEEALEAAEDEGAPRGPAAAEQLGIHARRQGFDV